eukprot:CAMPEP_0117545368 /NCGR_PEP_ID=MMETSP0784-20121206/46058_1 /TAXON_ID=39447 /ORGANISM="" /LENGTH=36 /DNA_ID= /DNA_START= /DNA_END= /DNA_ORIENTATION=
MARPILPQLLVLAAVLYAGHHARAFITALPGGAGAA